MFILSEGLLLFENSNTCLIVENCVFRIFIEREIYEGTIWLSMWVVRTVLMAHG